MEERLGDATRCPGTLHETHRTWILTANASKAICYERIDDRPKLTLVTEIEDPWPRPQRRPRRRSRRLRVDERGPR